MDGFDDLLAPSRDALERNPFADPFARSSSPDPWTNYTTSSSSLVPTDDASTTAFSSEVRSATPTLDDPNYAGISTSASVAEFSSYTSSEDPLESAKTLQDEEAELEHAQEREPTTPTEHAPLGSPRSPGFKESVSTTIEHVLAPTESATVTQHHTPPQALSPSPTVGANQPLTPASPPPLSPAESTPLSSTSVTGHAPSSSAASAILPTSTPLSAPTRSFYTPLDQPQSLDRSFSGLTLGGENVNGWQGMGQGSQTPFVSSAQTQRSIPEDEDDDDDKPILQARMDALGRAQQAGLASVPVSYCYYDSLRCNVFII
jgi:sorting nexin-1/2